jgi:hypothetical protein
MRTLPGALAVLALLALTGCRLSDLTTPAGEAMFRDDFSSAWSGWESSQAPGSLTHFQDGRMHVAIPGESASVITVPGLEFGDVQIEVDAEKVTGTDVNRIGLVCRYKDPQNFYFFVVSSDGFYGLGKVSGGEANLLGMTEMQRSEAVEAQVEPIHLRADCVGQELTLYINGSRQAVAADPEHPSGDAGLFAGTSSEAGLEVAFDNFAVLKP